jgi:hypothetical protein
MQRANLKFMGRSLVPVIVVLVGALTAAPALAAPRTHSATPKVTVGAQSRVAPSVSPRTINVRNLPKESAAAALRRSPRQLPVRMAHAGKRGVGQAKNTPVNHSPLASGAGLIGPVTTGPISFQGMADSATICPYFGGCQPPDMALATSPTLVLQGVNTSYEFFNTSGAPVLGPINDIAWYGIPALPNNCDPAGPFVSDPRAFYDPNTGLFWTATLQVEAAAFGVGVNCPTTSIYWVANVNPTSGVMHVYAFDMTLGGTINAGADYTEFGFNKDVVAFSGNMFDFTTGNLDFAETQFVNKAAMAKGLPVTPTAFTGFFACANVCVTLDTIQPVETITPTSSDPGVEYLINSFNSFGDPFGDDCFFIACHGYIVWAFDPTTNSIGGTFVTSFVSDTTYAVPPNADEPGCVQCIETIDTRITATPVYSVGGGQGLISFSLDTAVSNGGAGFQSIVAGVLWGQVQVTHFSSTPFANPYQIGLISFAGDRAASFGALMQAKGGRMVLVFDTMSGTLNPSIMAGSRSVTAPLGVMNNIHFLVKGPSATFDSRWGDFEATSYDGFGASGNHIWVASQYSISGDWATLIARV